MSYRQSLPRPSPPATLPPIGGPLSSPSTGLTANSSRRIASPNPNVSPTYTIYLRNPIIYPTYAKTGGYTPCEKMSARRPGVTPYHYLFSIFQFRLSRTLFSVQALAHSFIFWITAIPLLFCRLRTLCAKPGGGVSAIAIFPVSPSRLPYPACNVREETL